MPIWHFGASRPPTAPARYDGPMALLPLPAPLLDHLRTRYNEPHRHYHTLAHVESLLRQLDTHRALALEPGHIEAAIWYHDVVYDPRAADNELSSADVARFELMSIGWLGSDVERVAMMVEATQHHTVDGGDSDAALFLDFDLSVLAGAPEAYDAYVAAVRREFSWVPDTDWRAGRARVLQGFLARDTLFRTPALESAWDAAARENLRRELADLTAEGDTPPASNAP